MNDNKLLRTLSQNLLEISVHDEYYDVIIEVGNDPSSLYKDISYIYCGRISLEEYDTSDIIKILVARSELGLKELITYLQSFLIENKKNWMELNFNLIYQTSFENDSF
ncbi:hypothetical protein RhiirB3_446509 [Rhizophagus irregularis]|nr:hypothetical protein RhiirB3_446509 [Rhizophagus irregularis]